MSSYIVNPPIEDDLDYYRSDNSTIDRILRGQSTIAFGLRRSGKTSFLYRVQRKASRIGLPTFFLDLRDFLYIEGDPTDHVQREVNKIKAHQNALILLDEVDALLHQQTDIAILQRLLAACRHHTVAVACAPVIFLELERYPKLFSEFVESCNRYPLGPLTREDAADLLSQSKRLAESPVPIEIIEKIWLSGERLPIMLQALGKKHVDNIDLADSLAGLENFILSDLTLEVKEALISAAQGQELDPDLSESKLLISLGALIKTQDEKKAVIAGVALADFIRKSAGTSAATDWGLHACILHLSDLHFGPGSIDKTERSPDLQFARLKAVLERDAISPDFIVITGDLSWSGHCNEYRLVERFLENLVIWYAKFRKIDELEARRRILLLPGNHDAAWCLTNGLKPEETNNMVHYSLSPFANFVNRFHQREVFWDLERPYQKRCFLEPSVAFILISTVHFVMMERPDGKFGGHVQDQVAKMLEEEDVRNAIFRICLFHHNLRPFGKENGRCILDAESALVRFAKCEPAPDLILHGHVHQGEVDVFQPRGGSRVIPYSAVGSFGVRAKYRPGDDNIGRSDNEFAVVNLETDGATGRRFITQFYHLKPTSSGDWEWNARDKPKPHKL